MTNSFIYLYKMEVLGKGSLMEYRSTFKMIFLVLFLPSSFCVSAKPNQSMKLMLVGLQKQGKTTLLAHLKEKNEVRSPATTFNQRIKGEPAPSQSFGAAILRRASRAG